MKNVVCSLRPAQLHGVEQFAQAFVAVGRGPIGVVGPRADAVLHVIGFDEVEHQQVRLVLLDEVHGHAGRHPIALHAAGLVDEPGVVVIDGNPFAAEFFEPGSRAVLASTIRGLPCRAR